uniref:protein-serine/threonine phosphatase n=1 Tax=Palpitomonas bilix TaxID=652834 RepID=A0A7S3G4M7_9EUKA|mmetsp:Transcript_21439/g.55717  ORF Transcript_21439/g.55717 Transcript_21439/m.55717 type:complete len:264 (+) Transcript_21439:118-909(+)
MGEGPCVTQSCRDFVYHPKFNCERYISQELATNSGLSVGQDPSLLNTLKRKRPPSLCVRDICSVSTFMDCGSDSDSSPEVPRKRVRPPSLSLTEEISFSGNTCCQQEVTIPVPKEDISIRAFDDYSVEGDGFGGAAARGKRRKHVMEDRLCTHCNAANDSSIFGIFDGHGGIAAAAFVSESLPSICEQLIVEGADAKDALPKSLLLAEKGFCQTTPSSTSGCTAAVALVEKDRVVIANVGDSRIILVTDADVRSPGFSFSCGC